MSAFNELQQYIRQWIKIYMSNTEENTRIVTQIKPIHSEPSNNNIAEPRLILCFEHQRKYNIMSTQGNQELSIYNGQLLVLQTGSWLSPLAQKRFNSLGIHLNPTSSQIFWRTSSTSSTSKQQEPSVWAIPYLAALLPPLNEQRTVLHSLFHKRSPWQQQSLTNVLLDIITKTAIHIDENQQLPSPGKAYFTWIRICDYIDEHFHLEINRESVAQALALHPNHISRLFKEYAHTSFNHFLQHKRLTKACELLADKNLSIQKISAYCGITDSTYFSKVFKQQFKRSPSQYRAQRREDHHVI